MIPSEAISIAVLSPRLIPVVSVHVFVPASHVPKPLQSPPFGPSVIITITAASASGTINGIDGGTNSMLTRKIPKNTERLVFRVAFYFSFVIIMFDRRTSLREFSFSMTDYLGSFVSEFFNFDQIKIRAKL